jgi:hypothetical protein
MNSPCFKSTSYTTPDKPTNAKNTCLSHKDCECEGHCQRPIIFKKIPFYNVQIRTTLDKPTIAKHAYSSTNKDCERILHNLCTLDKGSLS